MPGKPRAIGSLSRLVVPALTLALSASDGAVAGPPERVSGKMVVDEVSEGLYRYRRETDEARRVDWLSNLARSRDPRVCVAMGEYLSARNPFPHQVSVAWLLTEHFMPSPASYDDVVAQIRAARVWWQENEADCRRRAMQLPR
jgi:hypothetical protein